MTLSLSSSSFFSMLVSLDIQNPGNLAHRRDLIRPHIEYCYQTRASRYRKLESAIKIGWHAKKSDKTKNQNKRLQLLGEISEIGINYFIRKKNEKWSHQNFQNNGIPNYRGHFFRSIYSNRKFTVKTDFKIKFNNLIIILLIYYCNKLPNQIKDYNSVKNLRINWMVLEKNAAEKNS